MALRTPAFNDAKTYGFEYLRLLSELELQEGAVNPGDFKVTAAAGGGMKVDVASGVALVKGDSGVPALGITQGLYVAVNDAAIANAVTLTASSTANPRIDRIILRVTDSSDLGSVSDTLALDYVTGTPTTGATLDNLSGAAAIPSDALHLADVLVPTNSTVVTGSNIRDRRKWARGAYGFTSYSGADITFTNTTAALITSAMNTRVELSGNPLEVDFVAPFQHGTAGGFLRTLIALDGVTQPGVGYAVAPSLSAVVLSQVSSSIAAPTAGSRVLAPYALTNGAGAFIGAQTSGQPLVMRWRERIGAVANNN